MGPMMGGSTGWDPVLIVAVILAAAVLLTATLILVFEIRHAGAAGRLRRRDASGPVNGGRPAAGAGSGEDPLTIVRERYARGEIGHAELVRLLDVLLRARQVPAAAGPAGTPGQAGTLGQAAEGAGPSA